MKEIEILVEVFDEKEKVLEALSPFENVGEKRTLDVYYFDPLRKDLQPGDNGRLTRSFRLREKDGKCSMAYKLDNFDANGIWTYSDEFETSFSDFEKMTEIVRHLGLQELVRIDNTKHTFKTPEYEIVFEEVKDLGFFLEVELLQEVEDGEVMYAKQKIQEFINILGLHVSEELSAGKPELMLKKKDK